jgi:hypothetical protein
VDFYELLIRFEYNIRKECPQSNVGDKILNLSATRSLDECLSALRRISNTSSRREEILSKNLGIYAASVEWLRDLRLAMKSGNWGEDIFEKHLRGQLQHQQPYDVSEQNVGIDPSYYFPVSVLSFNMGKEIF